MREEFACKNCGHIGETDGGIRGSFWMEMTMWSFIFPGPFYSIWRRMQRRSCKKCCSRSLVPIKSREGRALLEQHYLNSILMKKK
jgi:hypothetical protein